LVAVTAARVMTAARLLDSGPGAGAGAGAGA
jgi:hypothetical protein